MKKEKRERERKLELRSVKQFMKKKCALVYLPTAVVCVVLV